MTAAIVLLVIALAAANGSNDVSKGVATLAGAGVARYRVAILWGTAATLAGSLLSARLAGRLGRLFSDGIVSTLPTAEFTLAVLAGVAAWVGIATAARLPVSTTHALVGALAGGGLLLAPGAVNWASLPGRVIMPLLASVFAAYGIAALAGLAARRTPECLRLDTEPERACAAVAVPLPRLAAGTVQQCAAHGLAPARLDRAHWLSSGVASFARGLNDTPKIVAVGGFALVPAGMTAGRITVLVAVAMAAGSLAGGMRVARRLGEGVLRMSHRDGAAASLTTAILVGLGASRGLPMSTTHVATGAIAGTAGRHVGRLDTTALDEFLLAWTVTPLASGLLCAGVFATLR